MTRPTGGRALDGLTLVAVGSDDAGLCVDGVCVVPATEAVPGEDARPSD